MNDFDELPLVEPTPATRRVLARLHSAGLRPLIVGGAVRDALIARNRGEQAPTPRDVDIEVFGADSYDRVAQTLDGLGHADFRGRSYGVLAVRVDGEDIDVSLPRRDSKVGDGHCGFEVEVDATLTESEAFARRDFTVNSIGFDPATGTLIDHFGGASDLAGGILRPTSAAFGEDPLRVLRGAQFIARFGLHPSPEFSQAARDIAPQFAELAVERVWAEWRKLLRYGSHIGDALRALEDTGWLAHFGDLARLRGVQQDAAWHPEGDVLTHSLLAADSAAAAAERDGVDEDERELVVLAALLHDIGKWGTTRVAEDGRVTAHEHAEVGAVLAVQFVRTIGGPETLAQQVGALVGEHMAHASQGDQPTPRAVRGLARRLDAARVRIETWARVVDADQSARGAASRVSPAGAWVSLARDEGALVARKPLLRGAHLIAAGVTPGPQFKPILAAALDAQDAGEFDDEAGALEWFARNQVATPCA